MKFWTIVATIGMANAQQDFVVVDELRNLKADTQAAPKSTSTVERVESAEEKVHSILVLFDTCELLRKDDE